MADIDPTTFDARPLVSFIPANDPRALADLLTTGEAFNICLEKAIGGGAAEALSIYEDNNGLLFSHPFLTGGQPRRVVPDAMLKAQSDAESQVEAKLASALLNDQLTSFVQHPGSGALLRIRSTYWFVFRSITAIDARLGDCTGAAGFDPSIVGQPIYLSREAVGAWATGAWPPVAVPVERLALPPQKRGGGMRKPDWFPIYQAIIAEHRKREAAAALKGKTLLFPTNQQLADRIKTDSKGDWSPKADTVGKHAQKARAGTD